MLYHKPFPDQKRWPLHAVSVQMLAIEINWAYLLILVVGENDGQQSADHGGDSSTMSDLREG